MSLLRNILNLIYSIYCIALFFLVIFLLSFVYAAVYFAEDRTRTMIAVRATRAAARTLLKLWGYTFVVEGAEKIDPAATYMFVCNHTNMLDAPVTGCFLVHYYKVLAKKELRYVPIFGFLMRVTGVMVDRSDAESRKRTTEMIAQKLKEGVSFLIFPEGTRNKTDRPLKDFHGGAFRTALLAGAPVLPYVILDHRGLQPVGTFRLHPGRIRVRILDAVGTSGMAPDQADALQATVYKLMEDEILKEDIHFRHTK